MESTFSAIFISVVSFLKESISIGFVMGLSHVVSSYWSFSIADCSFLVSSDQSVCNVMMQKILLCHK